MTPFLFLFTMMYSLYTLHQQHPRAIADSSGPFIYPAQKTVRFAALPTIESAFKGEVTQQDARYAIVRQFLERYQSPMVDYAQNIIDAADKYQIDFRLLPAIAMQESNLCKKIPDNSFNCWGFGIYGKKVTRFSDYGEAIDTVTRTLATKYREKGLHTPDEIVKMYNPSNHNDWSGSVNFFMEELQ